MHKFKLNTSSYKKNCKSKSLIDSCILAQVEVIVRNISLCKIEKLESIFCNKKKNTYPKLSMCYIVFANQLSKSTKKKLRNHIGL